MGLGRLQSAWLRKCLEQNNSNDDRNLLKRMEDGEWMEMAQRRYVDGLTNTPTRKDDENLTTLLELLSSKRAVLSVPPCAWPSPSRQYPSACARWR